MLQWLDSISEGGRVLERMLGSAIQGWLVTVDPDGIPQPTTVWFVAQDDRLLIYSEPGKPKLRNLEANRRAAFHLNSDTYGEHWVVMTGVATVVEQDSPGFTPTYLAKYEEPLEHWGFDLDAIVDAYTVRIEFTPDRIRLRTP